MLSILIIFPLLCALMAFGLKDAHAIAFGRVVAALEFIAALILWALFEPNYGGMQFVEQHFIAKSFGLSYFVGVDGISLFLVILSAFITLLCMVFTTPTRRTNHFIIALLALESIMIGVFCALDALLFYLFWELSLVPMLYIIGVWGSENRLYAAVKFFLYTFAGSLFMLLGVLYIAYLHHAQTGAWSFSLLDWYFLPISLEAQKWLFLAFFLGIAVKVPLFPFHTWLPYAHGQAPTIGSVILAAILLKMGSYAFVRFSLPLFADASAFYTPFVAFLCLVMIVFGSMVAFAQKDMKQVIAYSSIAHMGVLTLGIFAINIEGIGGAVFFMLSHGVVSAGLFMLVGCLYERAHTKNIAAFGGLARSMPICAVIFAVLMMASVGLPLTIGFVGEFLSLLGFFVVSPIITLFAGSGIILGAVYMLYLYRRIFFGALIPACAKFKDLSARELCALLPLVFLSIWLGIYPKPVLTPINSATEFLLNIITERPDEPLSAGEREFFKAYDNMDEIEIIKRDGL